jgi:hypothetical protein
VASYALVPGIFEAMPPPVVEEWPVVAVKGHRVSERFSHQSVRCSVTPDSTTDAGRGESDEESRRFHLD